MPLNVTLHNLPGYVSIKITGPASLEEFVDVIATVGTQTRQRGDKRVLVDLLGVEGEMKFTDHFQLGAQVAQHLRHLDRLASVVPEDKITRTSEKVALKQGFQLRVFTSMAEAVQWLSEGLVQPSTITRDFGTEA